jgi:NTE family protein
MADTRDSRHVDTTTSYGIEEYLPDPEKKAGIGLALSGGGFRATLFHLGAVRRLNELGVLTKIETFTSVSGGSVTNALLARHSVEHPDAWSVPGRPIEAFDDEVARPLREFCRNDIRTSAVLTRFLPWNWFSPGTSIEALARRLASGPAGRHHLSEIPERPRFVFCSTDLVFRDQWVFDAGRRAIGSKEAGFGGLTEYWTIARAAAASGCFPIAFAAMPVPYEPTRRPGTYEGADREDLLRKLQLTDGGLYDNMAIEPIWKDHAAVLASDASPSFSYAPRWFGQLWLALRYPVTLLEQGVDIRRRWLVASFIRGDPEGSYWGIASDPANYDFDPKAYDPPVYAYKTDLIRDVISQIRIDFDAFSEPEIAVIENHGYLMAEIAVRRHAAELVDGPWPRPEVPHGDWMDEDRVRGALRGSEKTKLLGRKR